MQEKRIKHFVFIPFFTHQDPRYPHDIFDVDFLSKQLTVAKNNALRSLENQSNKNFEIVFFSSEKYFSDQKYEFIFSTLKDSVALPVKFAKIHNEYVNGKAKWPRFSEGDMADLVNNALKDYDFVIQSRIDFDDFIHKDVIADTQAKVEDCNSIMAYGYCKGYMYFEGMLYHNFNLWQGQGHIGILESLILKSSFAKNLPFYSIYSDHSRFKFYFKDFLERNGVKFEENMFPQNTTMDAYIYFRSEFSHNNLVTNPGHLEIIRKNMKIDPKITREQLEDMEKQLEEEFGFTYKLKSIK